VSRWDEELGRAKAAAQEAGKAILDAMDQDLQVRDKGDHGNEVSPVTVADLAANDVIESSLSPFGYGWLSEETEDSSGRLDQDLVWIVDPLDGTKEFLLGLPEFYVSIGLAYRGEVVVGVIYQPLEHRLVWASATGGAYENGESLQVSEMVTLHDATMAGSRGENKRRMFEPLLKHVAAIVPTGGMATKLHHVASGRCDFAVSLAPKNEWDLCGGDIIVREAGGMVTDLSGKSVVYNQADPLIRGGIIVAPEALFPAVRQLLLELGLT